MTRRGWLAAAVLAASCGHTVAADPRPVALPEGWRWESYRDVEIGVPGAWGYGSSDEHLGCGWQENPDEVGRPHGADLRGCRRPSMTARDGRRFVAFASTRAGDVAGSRTVDGDLVLFVATPHVRVGVLAEEAVRTRILATLRVIDADAHGCGSYDPIADTPTLRPVPAVGLGRLRGVRAVSVCRYMVGRNGGRWDGGPPLFSSARLTGGVARALVSELARAPVNRGQDDRPEHCSAEVRYGSEVVVLLVDSVGGRSRVHIRYQGCDGNGVDDGERVRRLSEAVRPVFAGANAVSGMSCEPGKILLLSGARERRCPR